MQQKLYCVYLLTNSRRTVLYIGVTGDLEKRVFEHKSGLVQGFTKKYNCHFLVYFETHPDPESAILREKTLKGRLRRKKIALIESNNLAWLDLSADWYARDPSLRSG